MVALPLVPAGVQVEPLTFDVDRRVARPGEAVQVTLVLAGAVNAAVWQSTALALPVQA